MKCPVCRDESAIWENIDRLRLKQFTIDEKTKEKIPIGMSMCSVCGFVTFLGKHKTEAEINEYYKKSYRPAPQVQNLFTGERKLQYHIHFLSTLFDEWKKEGIDKPVVGEIGSAYGMFLNWIKQCFPDSEICGTELTETFKRVAFHEYGIKLQDDIDRTKKYDLITSFHVLEHQIDPDIKLKEYASLLKDSGLFYLSFPIWFREATNGGQGGFDIDQYWHQDHINSWSEEHAEWIIARAGLEPIMKDTSVYGNTYLLKKSSKEIITMPKFDRAKYLKTAEDIYNAWVLLQENKTAMAIDVYKNCPTAWVFHYELNRAKFDKDKTELDKFIKLAIESCPNSADMLMFAGDVAARYGKYEESQNYLTEALKRKPNSPTILMGIASSFRMRAKKETDKNKKNELLKKSINILRFIMNISTEMMPQAISWSYHDQALIEVE